MVRVQPGQPAQAAGGEALEHLRRPAPQNIIITGGAVHCHSVTVTMEPLLQYSLEHLRRPAPQIVTCYYGDHGPVITVLP